MCFKAGEVPENLTKSSVNSLKEGKNPFGKFFCIQLIGFDFILICICQLRYSWRARMCEQKIQYTNSVYGPLS